MRKEQGFLGFLDSPKVGKATFIITFVISLGSSFVSGIIKEVIGNERIVQILWAISLFGFLFLFYLWWIGRRQSLVLVPKDQQPEKHRGLIVLVGTGRPGEDPLEQSAWDAIKFHLSERPGELGLQRCWLIATSGERGSLPIAQKLKPECQKKRVQTEIKTISDPFDLQQTYDVVQEIYKEAKKAGLPETDLIADFTGGVKPMSAGMLLACGNHRPMQYMYGRKAGIASVPRLIEFVPE